MSATLAWLTTALAAPAWIPLLLDVALKGAVLLLLTSALTRVLPGTSAAVRHQLWTVTLVSLLALPVLTLALPSWQVPLLPAAEVSLGAGRPAGSLEPLPAPGNLAVSGAGDRATGTAADGARAGGAGFTADGSTGSTTTGSAGSTTTASDRSEKTDVGGSVVTDIGRTAGMDMGRTGAVEIDAATSADSSGSAARGDVAPGSWSAADVAAVAVAIWLLGTVALLTRLLVGAASAAWLTSRARPVDDPAWRDLADRLTRRLGLAGPVDLRRSPRIRTPMAWGIRRAAVLLPAESEDWPAARRRVVLLHEIAHLKRRDCLVQLLADAATALHWVNPLAWWAARRLRAEREQACDDLVLAAGTPRADYARHLLEIARGLRRLGTPGWAAVSMARPSQLEGRLLAILDPDRNRGALTRVASVGLIAAVILFVVPLATLQPWATAEAASPGAELAGPNAVAAGPGAEQELREAFRQVLQELLESGALDELLDRGVVDELLRGASMDHGVGATTHRLEHLISHPAEIEGAMGVSGVAAGAGPLVDGMIRHLEGLLGDPDLLAQMATEALARDQDAEGRQPGGQEGSESSRDAVRRRVLEAMFTALRDTDPGIRQQAAHSLGRMEDAEAVDALGRALVDDDSPSVRKQAAWGLGVIENATAIPHLEAAVDDPETPVRAQVVWALGMIEDPAAIPALSRMLGDASADVRAQAAWALGMIEDAAAVDGLATALDDEEASVRKQAAWALGMIEDPAGVDVLVTAVDDADPEVRGQVAWALGMIEDAAAIPALSTLLTDERPGIRKQAGWALGMIEDAAAVDALVGALSSDSDEEVRAQAAWALGMIESESAVDALIDALEDDSEAVRKRAMEALSRVMH